MSGQPEPRDQQRQHLRLVEHRDHHREHGRGGTRRDGQRHPVVGHVQPVGQAVGEARERVVVREVRDLLLGAVALVLLIFFIVYQQAENHLLQPVIMGQALSLHPLVVLLALTIGTIVGGILCGSVVARSSILAGGRRAF